MTTYVAVVGSRDFTDYGTMEKILDKLFRRKSISKPVIIVSGGARGADSLAERYAANKHLQVDVYNADWDRFGRSAGFIRNKTIVKKADIVVAFWDGTSRGTANTIEEACKNHLPVVIYNFATAEMETRWP